MLSKGTIYIILIFGTLFNVPKVYSIPQNQCLSLFSKVRSEENKGLRYTFFSDKARLNHYKITPDVKTQKLRSNHKTDQRDILVKVLKSMGKTLFLNASEKATLERGILKLAVSLKNEDSLELEYITDERASETVFRLNQVVYLRKNGSRNVVSKNPLLDNGEEFLDSDFIIVKTPSKSNNQKSYHNQLVSSTSLKERLEKLIEDNQVEKGVLYESHKEKSLLVEAIEESVLESLTRLKPHLIDSDKRKIEKASESTMSVPIFPYLSGPVVESIKKWAPVIPFLSKKELRSLKASEMSLKRLYLLGLLRRNLEFLKVKVIKKQSMKVVLFGALFFAYSNFHQNSLEVKTTPSLLSQESHQMIDSVFKNVSPYWEFEYPKWEQNYREQVSSHQFWNQMGDRRSKSLKDYIDSMPQNDLVVYTKSAGSENWVKKATINEELFDVSRVQQKAYHSSEKGLIFLSFQPPRSEAFYLMISKENTPQFYDGFLNYISTP